MNYYQMLNYFLITFPYISVNTSATEMDIKLVKKANVFSLQSKIQPRFPGTSSIDYF